MNFQIKNFVILCYNQKCSGVTSVTEEDLIKFVNIFFDNDDFWIDVILPNWLNGSLKIEEVNKDEEIDKKDLKFYFFFECEVDKNGKVVRILHNHNHNPSYNDNYAIA